MGWVVNATPWLLYPWERDPVPTVQEAGWTQGQYGQEQTILPPRGFDPRTIYPIGGRYTDYALPAHSFNSWCGQTLKAKIMP
jgi:hypothetical protein